MSISVIYKDDNFLAVSKPAGILVHGRDSREERGTVVAWLRDNYPEVVGVGDDPTTRPGIVHRLDKDTSGVLLIARNQKSFQYLKSLFQDHQIKKRYKALVRGVLKPPQGIIDAAIGLKSGSVKRTIFTAKAKMVKPAVTEYKVEQYLQPARGENSECYSLVSVIPRTGRTHQIRVHLASKGHPVVGDFLYGTKDNSLGIGRQFLHAESIEFCFQDGKRIRIEAELPDELQKALNELIPIKQE